MDRVRPVTITAARKGETIYIVEYAESESAKETASEKVRRLIMNEPITFAKQAS